MTRAQNQALLSPEAFSKAVDAVQEAALFLVSQDEMILTWNSGAETLTGYPAAAAIGRPLSILTREDVAGTPSLLDRGALAANGLHAHEVDISHRNGSALRVVATVTALGDVETRPTNGRHFTSAVSCGMSTSEV